MTYSASTLASPRQSLQLQRMIIWGACVLSYGLTLGLLRVFKSSFGLDPFSIVVQYFIPLGGVIVAALAISGFMLAALRFRWKADLWDLLLLMMACMTVQFADIAIDYWSLMQARPDLAGRFTYGKYVVLALTTPEYMVNSYRSGTAVPQAIGESGFILLLPRLGFMMALAKLAHSRFETAKAY